MKHLTPLKYIVFISLVSLLIMSIMNTSAVQTYIHAVKSETEARNVPVDQSGLEMNTKLEQRIKELASQIDQEPIDARIDRVWQAIPGFNGIRVNQSGTLYLASQLKKLSQDTLVLEEVEPNIQLDDLPPTPIYRGNPHKQMVSLMVNVAWGTEFLPSILETLEEHDVKVTFFIDGQWLESHEEMAYSMLQSGHELGNHAYSHPDLRRMDTTAIRTEIEKTQQLIEELGTQSLLFAPPSGAYDERVVQLADIYGMKTILWTLDTVDWKKPSKEEIVNRIIPNLENGALILMHPTETTAQALPELIEGIRGEELHIDTVSELLRSERPYTVERFVQF